MSFKSLLKSFARSTKEPPKNLYDPSSSLPEGNDMAFRLELLYKERKTAVPARRQSPIKKGIAICLVIVNELRHETIWRDWVESVQSSELYYGELFIHAKFPDQIHSPWVRSKLIGKNFNPEWNSTEVIRAMLATLDHALTSSNAERFIFATESCIPIFNLPTMAETLYQEDKSWLNARNEAESSWERATCFEAVDSRVIPRDSVWKALPGWIMLTRRHAMDIMGLLNKTGGYDFGPKWDGVRTVDIVGAFGPPGQWSDTSGGVFAPEEMFFATMLSLLGYLKPGYESGDEVKQLSISYATWARRGDANPQVILDLNSRQLEKMRRTGALMARKFNKDDRLHRQWQHLVLPPTVSDVNQSTFTESLKRPRDNDTENMSDIAKKQRPVEAIVEQPAPPTTSAEEKEPGEI